MKKTGLSFVEIMIVSVVLVMVIGLVAQGVSMAGLYFFTGQLNHAVQGAALVTAQLEADLRQAARDPRTGAALVQADGAISFYRIERQAGGRGALVPVRWSVGAGTGDAAELRRTSWDGRRFVTRAVPLVLVARAAGIAVHTDGPLVSVAVAVLARDRRNTGLAGGANDAVGARVMVAIPFATQLSARFLKPMKTLDELP